MSPKLYSKIMECFVICMFDVLVGSVTIKVCLASDKRSLEKK